MAERASIPLFVPRTVATFERAATRMARRVTAPVRTLAARALSFADRVVGNWAGAGVVDAVGRPAMRAAAERGGAMLLPRPWYELDADDAEAGDDGWIAGSAAATTPTATAAAARIDRVAPAAERGAAIARTTLTAPPEAPARLGTTPAATGAAERRPASSAPTTATPTATATPTVAAASAGTTTATSTSATDAGARGEANDATAAPLASADDVRAAAALGLDVPRTAPAAVAAPRATTPLARALAHTAWVDAQLRPVMAPVQPLARGDAGYVFVTPAAVEPAEATRDGGRAAAAATTVSPVAPRPSAATVVVAPLAPTTIAPAASAPAASVAPAVVAAPATWTPALPDPRLAASLPTTIARRVAEFVARLVGAQTAADAAPLPPLERTTAAAVDGAQPPAAASVRAPARAFLAWTPVEPQALAAATSPVAAAGPSWRPGAAAARVERMGVAVDARVTAAWGEPASVRPVPRVEQTVVAPAAEEPARATGPARVSQFMDRLVGVQAVRATAPLPLSTPSVARDVVQAATAASLAPGGIGVRSEQLAGAVGVRAAGLSIEFVDPARLSVFHAPSAAMPTVAPAAEPVSARDEASDTIMPAPRPLFAPAATTPTSAPLTAEEWSLVATFPSAATAFQMVAARQAATWQPETVARAAEAMRSWAPAAEPATRAAAWPSPGVRTARIGAAVAHLDDERAPATAGVAAAAPVVTRRAGAPADYVIPLVAEPTPVRARLPGGRAPRGSFTWPRVAESAVAAHEWAVPAAAAVAEQAAEVAQAAPGTPLWGAMPSLVTVAPALAASTGMMPPAATAGATATVPSGEAAVVAGARASSAARAADAPALTLMTAGGAAAAARDGGGGDTGEARGGAAASGSVVGGGSAGGHGGATRRGAGAPPLTLAAALAAAPTTVGPTSSGASGAMAPGATGTGAGAGGAGVGPAARALELARPFLRLVEGGVANDAPRPATPRFYEPQPQPVVAAVPSSDAASRMIDAIRSQPAATPSDDRVTLADLTLIAIASATQQVAASPAGGGPSAGAPAAVAPEASTASSSHGAGGKTSDPHHEIEELARAAFDELQRRMEIARERSGDNG